MRRLTKDDAATVSSRCCGCTEVRGAEMKADSCSCNKATTVMLLQEGRRFEDLKMNFMIE